MRATSRQRSKSRQKSRFQETPAYTLSKAKTYLGRLILKAQNGEPVYIIAGRRRFILQEVPEIEPIPSRPPGYFSSSYTREITDLDNRLAEASLIEKPEDFE